MLIGASGTNVGRSFDSIESVEVTLKTLPRVFRAGSRPQDECPITGLRQQQFAAGLFESAFLEARSFGMAADQGRHSFLRDVEVRVNPLVGFVEPHAPITLLAPARRSRFCNLIRRKLFQVFLGRYERKNLLIVTGLANEIIQEFRPFIPPMAEEFGIVRRDAALLGTVRRS
jgi:hypothetical protein